MKKLGATQFFLGNPPAQTALVAGDIWANFMGSSWALRLRRAGHEWAKFALLKVGNNVGIWERGHMGLASGSRNVLQDAGIEALTVPKALAAPLPAKTGREIWIIDESSQLASRDVNRAQAEIRSQKLAALKERRVRLLV